MLNKKSPFILAATVALLAAASLRPARADSIGISFSNGGAQFSLASTTSAGVVAQINWNNYNFFGGAGQTIRSNNGITTGLAVTLTGGSTGALRGSSPDGDERLNSASLFNNVNSPISAGLNNINYGTYDIYVYNLNDAGTQQRTTIGSSSFTALPPILWSQGISTTMRRPLTFTPRLPAQQRVFIQPVRTMCDLADCQAPAKRLF